MAPPFLAHLGACVQIVTSFRRKPEQLFPPPLPVLLPPFLASWPWALGCHLPFPPSLSLCYFTRSSPTSSPSFCSLTAVSAHFKWVLWVVFFLKNTRIPNLLRSPEIWVRGRRSLNLGEGGFLSAFYENPLMETSCLGKDSGGRASEDSARILISWTPTHTHQKRPWERGQPAGYWPWDINACPLKKQVQIPSGHLKHEAQTQMDAPITLLRLAWWRSGLRLRPSQPCFPCSRQAFPRPPLPLTPPCLGFTFAASLHYSPTPNPKRLLGARGHN